MIGRLPMQRKESVEAVASDFQREQRPGLSWEDLASIGAWFDRMAGRYGLKMVFRENGII